MRQIHLGFGEQSITATLREEQIIDILEGKQAAPITDIPKAVQEALQYPIGSAPLRQIVAKGDSVAIIVSDVTRMWIRYDLFLPALLDELNAAGISDENIQLIVALGAHRMHTDEENNLVYGEDTVKRVTIRQSCAKNSGDFVSLGQTSRGTPVEINRYVDEADKVILTGGISYHSMAGFGGGRKAILPGVSSYASIQANHSLCLHAEIGKGLNPNCDSGNLDTNPMHQDQLEIAAMLKPAFLLNAVFTPDGQFARFVAGHWQEAWQAGCKTVEQIYGVSASQRADVTLASAGGFPKDINFYQGSKGLENAYAITKKGGVIIAVMECRDIYEPADFSQWFEYSSLYDREMALRQSFTVPGFVALKLGIIAQTVTVIMVTLAENTDFFTKAGILTAETIEAALKIANEKLGTDRYKITVMPHASVTLPLLQPQA